MNHLRITQAELAALCGVSQGTVDRALNGRGEINPETKEKILSVAKKYGFRNSKGNSKIERTKSIGVILFDLNNEFFSKLITDIEQKATEKGYLITVMFTHYSQEAEVKCIRQLYSSGVDAILLCSVQNSREFILFTEQLCIPVIALGNKIEGIPYVGTDDFTAMRDATLFLKKLYGNIVYYSPALRYENAFAQKRRFDGFLSVVGNTPYAVVTDQNELKESYFHGTAILCSTDLYAMYVHTHCKADCIMGFDNISSLDKLKLPISSVDTDTNSIAEKAIELIESGEKKDVIIPHRIVERN